MKNIIEENFDQLVLKSEKPVLVDFGSEYCMQCGALDPTMDKLEKAYPNVKFYSANISDIGNIATRYGIICLPTVIIFKDGKVIHQLYGNLPQNVFEEELNKL